MYKLLLVDDEPEIVDWLYELMESAKHMELEVHKAYSAMEALAVLNEFKIDIVLSDIRMPGMSGLQLLEKIKHMWPRCSVIFLTGYKEFDYVYSAIQYQEVKYLLKTEEDEKIISVIEEVIKKQEEQLKNEDIIAKAEQQMEMMLPLLQDRFLKGIIYGTLVESDIVEDRFTELKIPLNLNQEFFIVIGRFEKNYTQSSFREKEQIAFSVNSIFEQYGSHYFRNISCQGERSDLIWLVIPKEVEEDKTVAEDPFTQKNNLNVILKATIEDVQKACSKALGVKASFAYSSSTLKVFDAAERYDSLIKQMGYRFDIGREIIVTEKSFPEAEDNLENEMNTRLNRSLKHLHGIKNLENYLDYGDIKGINKLLEPVLGQLREAGSRNNNVALEIYYSLTTILLRHINRNKLTEKLAFKISLHKLTRVDYHDSWNQAVEYILNLVEAIADIQIGEIRKSETKIVAQLKQYILENLGGDLSLTRLADMVYLNSSYLSRLFKEETGLNISDYIIECRIEKAKELLVENLKKISEIAQEVGYDSSHSFARFFKNAVGIPPQQYRESFFERGKEMLQR